MAHTSATIDPHTKDRRVPVDLEQPCHFWEGNKNDHGYGRIMVNAQTFYVHRLSYQLHVGPIPRGWEADHLCHNVAFDAGLCTAGPCQHRACFNPAHLDAVPSSINSARGGHPLHAVARSERCGRNHDLTDPSNVYVNPTTGKRRCRTCTHTAQQARRAAECAR